MNKNNYNVILGKLAKIMEESEDVSIIESAARAYANVMGGYSNHLQLAGTFVHAMEMFDPDGEFSADSEKDRNAYDRPADLN